METQTPSAAIPAQPTRHSNDETSTAAPRYDVGVFVRVFTVSIVALAVVRAVSQAGWI